MSNNLFEKIISYFLNNWQTKKGFFVSLPIIIITYLSTAFQFINQIYFWLFIMSILIIWFIVWSFLSGRIELSSNKKIVYLCFNIDLDGSKNYRRVIKKLHLSINEIGLNDSIIIRSIGSDLIRNRFDAHKFCRSKKIDLIIWGQTDYGFRNNEKILLFEVYHTLNISSNISSKLDLFLSDLNLIFAKRSWAIKEINELEEYKIVANNFLETILFILGIFFYDEGHFTQSIKVFEFLLPILEKKNLKEKTDEYKLQTNRVKYLLNELYFLYSRILHDENKIKESFIYLRKIQEEIISNPIPLFINLARVSYLLGDLENAKNYTEKIRKINRRHPAVCINHGFFGIKKKNYDRVLFWYNEFLKIDKLEDIDIFSVITFLDDEYNKDNSEPAFLFGLAIVNGFLDPQKGKRDLHNFIKLTKNHEEYKLLVKRAKELLK